MMGATFHRAGCCCPVCSEDCSDCESVCNDAGDINVTVAYTPCGGAVDCDSLAGGDGVLGKLDTCDWSTDETGDNAGDFSVRILCNDSDQWELQVWYVPDVETACRSWGNVVCVFCVSGRPTGVFVVPMYDEGIPGACGNATVTLSIP